MPIDRELQLALELLLFLDDGVELGGRFLCDVLRVDRLFLLHAQIVAHREAGLVERNLQLVILFLSVFESVGEGFTILHRCVAFS